MFLLGILWLSHTLCCIGWSLKILGHNFCCLAPGCLSLLVKGKNLGREDLLRIGLRLPDTRFGWWLVGAFHGRLPAAAGNGRKLCHPRETSLCAPAKGGEAKFSFDSQKGCRLGFCRGACLMGWCTFFLVYYIFFSLFYECCVCGRWLVLAGLHMLWVEVWLVDSTNYYSDCGICVGDVCVCICIHMCVSMCICIYMFI